MQNKRGQGLSTNAIILIVLGVLVLVILIAGFTLGWGKIAPWIKTESNVGQISQACQLACSTLAKYNYCSVGRELFTEEGTEEDVSCYFLSEKRTKYGIEKCPAISCDISNSLEKATEKCKIEGEEIYYLGEKKIEMHKCIVVAS